MTIHVHALTGCSPDPLAHYLKAIGILRLVSEQKDDQARGWWDRDVFKLATTLDREELVEFLLNEYEPTPLLGPWGARSGFYEGSSERSAREALNAIGESKLHRLERFRRAIADVRVIMSKFGIDKKPSDMDKELFMGRLRTNLSGEARAWLETSVTFGPDGPGYPAIVGTGGNEGSGSYSSNYAQAVVEIVLERRHDRYLPEALFRAPTPGVPDSMAGHFLPIGVEAPNGSTGYVGGGVMSPWTLVLCLEGALPFTPSLTRYTEVSNLPHGAAPFAVASSAVGYGSASEHEKQRGEQWFPLWNRACILPELKHLIAEGRAHIGTKPARRSVDFARAVAQLGVDRGVSAFQRFGYVQRNGRNVLAVSLGRWSVAAHPDVHLLDDVAVWVDRLRRAAASDHAPGSVMRSARMCEEAMLGVCRDGANSRRWRDLVVALGAAEHELTRSPRFTAERRLRPLPPLRPGWLNAAAADIPEFRLGVALAAQHGLKDRGFIDRRDPVRRHFLPLDRTRRGFASSGDSLQQLADVVCVSGAAVKDLISLVRRRMEEAGRRGLPRLPLAPLPGTEARARDISAWIDGEIDDGLVIALARGFMAIDWPRKVELPVPRSADRGLLGAAGLFHLAYQPYEIPLDGDAPVPVPLDPTPLARLAAGDLRRATEAVVRRLSSAGLRPHVHSMVGSPELARRIASSLAFPLKRSTVRRLAGRLTHPTLSMDRSHGAADQIPLEQEA